MKQFSIPEAMSAKLVNVNVRAEKHGRVVVPAIDCRLQITAPNTILDQLNPGLRHALYVAEADAGEETQAPLEGVEAVSDTPVLRVEGVDPVRLQDELTGYGLTFDVGTGRKDSIVELDGVKLKNFQVEALQGGSVRVLFTAQAAGLKHREFGILCMLIDSDVGILLDPPSEEEAQGSLTPRGDGAAAGAVGAVH